MRKIGALFAALCFLVILIPAMAFAQDTAIVSRSSWLYEVWTIVQPVVALAVTLVGTPLVGWIAFKLSSLIGKNDEATRLKIEGEIRNALHAAAANALKYAIAKRTGPIGDLIAGKVPPDLISDAVEYVRSKNPDAAAAIDDPDLIEIILSKVVDVQAALGQAKAALPATGK